MASKYEGYSNEEVVGTLELSNFTEVRITALKDSSNELQGVDIRQWYCTQKDPEKKPTQKGVRINKDLLPEFLDLLQSIN
jgi:hypothetical protein